MIDDELKEIIVGRIKPSIYAFTTNTVPNYLKVGDTYRPVDLRLTEWKNHYKDLEKKYQQLAIIDDEVFFRDYSVHKFLETDLKKVRLTRKDIATDSYYSNEFFKETNEGDIDKAIEDIKESYTKNNGKYTYYNTATKDHKEKIYVRNIVATLRPNQEDTVNAFEHAVNSGRKKLLMYAVMRFGKSFTSLMCAVRMNYKFVVVVSGKADVKEEWKNTTLSIDKFIDYTFLESKDLYDETIIDSTLAKSQQNRIVLFLTLQDLQGTDIKERHKQVFEHKIDLLIVDETHFGARAEKYGEVLKDTKISKKDIEYDLDDLTDYKEADKLIKTLQANVTLHLSGTPYRILMDSEFQKEDIIAFYQFSDIIHAKETWDNENLLNDEFQEWDNPYYGFPQMIRFAFNPNESSIQKMNSMQKDGISYNFSDFFRAKSLEKKADNSHKVFIHEKEILELFQCIDGKKTDKNILDFLNYKKIQEGNMCRHMVVVLPYRTSCDALEELFLQNKEAFDHLCNYEIINIAGKDNEKKYKDVDVVKKTITSCEAENKKTITLTVNRMLTGCTVPEWDTMLYLKDTMSPQDYDQAIFRLQNQYIREMTDEKGDVIKYNMKPQTLLVDFSPNRMFYMQEKKSLIYNINTEKSGNSKLEDRIKEEVRISPIIAVNASENKLVKITEKNILDVISNYSKDKSVADEAEEIPVDLSLLKFTDIRKIIEQESELGSKKGGISFKPIDDESTSTDLDVVDGIENSPSDNNFDDTTIEHHETKTKEDTDKEKDSVAQFKMYYSRILFFAFLTKSPVISLEDVITVSKESNNARIIKNLGLHIKILQLFQANMNPFTLSRLDYKIKNMHDMAQDTSLDPIERCLQSLKRFGKLGASEVVTPQNICTDMVHLIPDEDYRKTVDTNAKIVDIAGKMGEFVIALYKKYESLNIRSECIKNTLYTIPTSSVAYEFTHNVYEVLGLNTDCIANFTSYDLLTVKKLDKHGNPTIDIDYDKVKALLCQDKPFNTITLQDNVDEGSKQVTFELIVGNPPYQENDGGGVGSSALPVYNYFVETAINLTPKYISMIMPARWFTGGRGLDNFRDKMLNDKRIQVLHDFLHTNQVFTDVEIKGGICYFLWNIKWIENCKIYSHKSNHEISFIERPLLENDVSTFIRNNEMISIIRKIKALNELSISEIVSANDPFGFDMREDNSYKRIKPSYSNIQTKDSIAFYYNGWRKEGIGYMNIDQIRKGSELIFKPKVFIPKAWGTGKPETDWLNPFIPEEKSCCTETYLVVGSFENYEMANNFIAYSQTRFFHAMVSVVKITQNTMQGAYKFVPLQDFTDKSDIDWNKSVAEIDKQLYNKYELTDEEIAFIEKMIKPME